MKPGCPRTETLGRECWGKAGRMGEPQQRRRWGAKEKLTYVCLRPSPWGFVQLLLQFRPGSCPLCHSWSATPAAAGCCPPPSHGTATAAPGPQTSIFQTSKYPAKERWNPACPSFFPNIPQKKMKFLLWAKWAAPVSVFLLQRQRLQIHQCFSSQPDSTSLVSSSLPV